MAQTPYRVTAPYQLNLRYDGTANRGSATPQVRTGVMMKNRPRTEVTMTKRDRT